MCEGHSVRQAECQDGELIRGARAFLFPLRTVVRLEDVEVRVDML